MSLCCLKCGWISGLRPGQLAGLDIPPIGSQLVHSLSIVYQLKLIRAGCGTRFRVMRSLTFAACGNKTLFSIIFTTSPLAKSWIRACMFSSFWLSTGITVLHYMQTKINKGPFKCYVTLFFWKLDPHPPPRNANNGYSP